MPRRTPLADAELDGLDNLPADPPAKTATPARRGPGRPKGSTTKGRIPVRTSTGKIASRAEMIATVKGQIYVIVAPAAAMWEIRDPECAEVLHEPTATGEDRLEAIVDRIVAMIARNSGVLEFLAKSTLLADAGVLAMLLTPIIKKVWAHHGPMGVGHTTDPEALASDYARNFPAYAPAAPAFVS